MSTAAIRDKIVAKLTAIEGFGLVHRFERYAHKQSDFKALYETDGKVLGWFVRRISVAEQQDTTTYNGEVMRWRIEGFMSLDDATETEITFDALIDAARAAFRSDLTLGGAVETTVVDGQAGLQLEDSGPAMFAGVLCHRARMSLATMGSVEIGDDVLDDFATGNTRWDMAPADETTDAEDNIELETTP